MGLPTVPIYLTTPFHADLPLLVDEGVHADGRRSFRLAQQVVDGEVVRREEVDRLVGDGRRRDDAETRPTRHRPPAPSLVESQRLLHLVEGNALRQSVEVRWREGLSVLTCATGLQTDVLDPREQILLEILRLALSAVQTELCAFFARIASMNFSYTRGTATKKVGRALRSVATSVPRSASGRARYIVTRLATGIMVSTYCAAMWFSGRKEMKRSSSFSCR